MALMMDQTKGRRSMMKVTISQAGAGIFQGREPLSGLGSFVQVMVNFALRLGRRHPH